MTINKGIIFYKKKIIIIIIIIIIIMLHHTLAKNNKIIRNVCYFITDNKIPANDQAWRQQTPRGSPLTLLSI